MEMPVSYIILKMMEVLKYHNKETKVSLLQIERIIDNILESSIFTDNEKKSFIKFSIKGNEITTSIKIQQNSIKNNTPYTNIYKDCKYIIRGANP